MALKKKIENDVGQATEYHKLSYIETDFDKQLHLYIDSYASEDYRNMEIEQQNQIQKKIDKYYELLKKEERTEEEQKEFNELKIQELEAFKIEPKVALRRKYTLEMTDDLRKSLYERIKKEIPDFKDAENIY